MDFQASFAVGQRSEFQVDYWNVCTPAAFANTTSAEDPTHHVPSIISAGMARTGTRLYQSPRMSDSWQSFSGHMELHLVRSNNWQSLRWEPIVSHGCRSSWRPVCEGCAGHVPIVCPSGYCMACCKMEACDSCSVFEGVPELAEMPNVEEMLEEIPDSSDDSDDSIWPAVSDSGDEESEDSGDA